MTEPSGLSEVIEKLTSFCYFSFRGGLKHSYGGFRFILKYFSIQPVVYGLAMESFWFNKKAYLFFVTLVLRLAPLLGDRGSCSGFTITPD